MNFRAATLLLLFAAATPNLRYFRYDRPLVNTPAQNQQACVTLDPSIFTQAGQQLASLRLYNGQAETPYVVNYSQAPAPSPKTITPLNVGLRNGSTTFDAAMPEGSYRNLEIEINAQNFIATVHVSGSQTQTAAHPTSLGAYTIFDFTRQKLGRSTVLHLPESDFRYLHFQIDGPIRPDQITSLTTGRLPAKPPQYVTVATSSAIQQKGRDSVIELAVPANVPIDQILFTPGAQPVNFSRDVTVTVARPATRPSTDAEEPQPPATFSGNILRIHTTQNGHKIDEENLTIAAFDYATSFAPAETKWTIAIHNQDDAPIQIPSFTLQMIARTLCFDAIPGANYKLYYGDAALSSPRYDYASLFVLDKNAARANLGSEEHNPNYQPRPDTRPFTEKHPALLWIALVLAVLILGLIALRSSRQLKQP